jgi:hypothetical protein
VASPKGVRDIVAGLVALALIVWGERSVIGTALLIEAIIPAGDMLFIFDMKGSVKADFGIHGFTAALMILAAVPLMTTLAYLLRTFLNWLFVAAFFGLSNAKCTSTKQNGFVCWS